MITSQLRELVARAVAHARECNDDQDHTVAAALLTRSGATVLGLNAHHFLGGPCGEISALSNHAARRRTDPVVAVVAVYGPTGEVISPCGKCRQVLFDLDPGIECVVRGSGGLEAIEVRQLLPYAYRPGAAEEPQRIHMWQGYEDSVRKGVKRQTIRVDDPFCPGPALLVFETGSEPARTLRAEVTDVDEFSRAALTAEHARRDGFGGLAELHKALDAHYPGLNDDDTVEVVTFTITEAT